MRALHKLMAAGREALQRVRLARTTRKIRQVENFLAREQDMHAEQMLFLRGELQRLRDRRLVLSGEAGQYTQSGAWQ